MHEKSIIIICTVASTHACTHARAPAGRHICGTQRRHKKEMKSRRNTLEDTRTYETGRHAHDSKPYPTSFLTPSLSPTRSLVLLPSRIPPPAHEHTDTQICTDTHSTVSTLYEEREAAKTDPRMGE